MAVDRALKKIHQEEPRARQEAGTEAPVRRFGVGAKGEERTSM